jgi:hypothetical protein
MAQLGYQCGKLYMQNGMDGDHGEEWEGGHDTELVWPVGVTGK